MKAILNQLARRECEELTPAADSQLALAMERILAGRTALEDIKELEGYPGYFRWKPSPAIRQTMGEFRLVFRYCGDKVEIVGATHDKDNKFYPKIESRIRQGESR